MLILYGITIFVGAALLFAVQPMVGRMVLPLLGGSPAVWNTTLVFYQTALLAGYGYAHVSTKWLGWRRQAVAHGVLLLLPLLVLPIGIPRDWTPPTAHNPIPWLLALLTVAVGLPFFVVSATSPLLQRWFSVSGHRAAADPYFLYAASNCGSLLALLSYPALIEPRLRLSEQSRWWAIGYVALVVLIAICGLGLWRTKGSSACAAEPAPDLSGEQLTARRRWRWLLLALVPCSLMLSVTTYITGEIAPIPLLWVIPLAIYLLAFILVFARRRWLPHRWMVRALPFAVVSVAFTLVGRVQDPAPVVIGLHLVCQFVISMVCLGELAQDRPSANHLTEFYLWISVGGVLGGMFNALLAPVIFSSVAEYPLTLVLACLLTPRSGARSEGRQQRTLDFALPVGMGLVTANLIVLLRGRPDWDQAWMKALMFGVPLALCLAVLRRPRRFAFGVGCVFIACSLWPVYEHRILHVDRSFFGINRVSLDAAGRFHWLTHGNTVHGIQSLDPRHRAEPLGYFTRTGPVGQAFGALVGPVKRRVGVVGLGAGSLASYAARGERWTFYEIDPVVERIARDPRYFTYLPDCRAEVDVVLGDARLSLEKTTDGQFGILVLDAYNSDTVPLHLITREALALYLRKLAPDGALIFHVSNRHLRLERVLGRLAQDAGLTCLAKSEGSSSFVSTGKLGSKWVVMARRPDTLGSLMYDPSWLQPPPHLKTRLWTDDYASVFSVFDWR
jgi:hypothetical protein